jgi:hypothetical protein
MRGEIHTADDTAPGFCHREWTTNEVLISGLFLDYEGQIRTDETDDHNANEDKI